MVSHESVLSVLSYPMSATAIAKALGYSRAHESVKRTLKEMLEEGIITTVLDKGNVLYKKSNPVETQEPVTSQENSTNNSMEEELNEFDKEKYRKILKVLTDNPNSGYQIGKLMGYSSLPKSYRRLLDRMADRGIINRYVEGDYKYYSKKEEGGVEKEKLVAPHHSPSSSEEKKVGEEKVRRIGTKETSFVPEETFGYKIKPFDESDEYKYQVTNPKGTVINLKEEERLFVINLDPNYEFIITKPEDVMSALSIWSGEKGITHFVVEDMSKGGYVTDPKEIMNTAMIFVKAKQHNKAAVHY